jgi:acyl-coenzyme A thioesterase PaaI-like protein
VRDSARTVPAVTLPAQAPDAAAVNEMVTRAFPGSTHLCHELGPDFALARHEVTAGELRPGGFISGPTQFGLADAALWYLVFGAIGRIEPMALTSELSIRYLRPAQGQVLWARATLESAGRRNVVGTVRVWADDREDRPTATAQGTYALPLAPPPARAAE